LSMAKGAIEFHIDGLIAEGLPIPKPGRIEQYRDMSVHADGTWAIVSVTELRSRVNAKRINITVPERVLESIDLYADEHGKTRSGLLVEAAVAYIGSKKSMPKSKKQR